ncbi:MAG TPA: alanine racemase [Pyrinomonadaceae bacterium]|jgi:D-serine deaminase-like pyridoxal phosphate-dependent protein|nr:alanine racemase [Pyrinomonadaceae bacterium]
MTSLYESKTPALLLDVERVRQNAERMRKRADDYGVRLRPHVKTHKCVEVARIQTDGHGGALTVSTLAEARAFSAHGFKDITYAVPIEPGKFDEAIQIASDCERLALITDDVEIPSRLDDAARQAGVTLDLFLKVDCGYHRCGVEPTSPDAFEIPRRILDASNLRFAGILTHAGHSYHSRTSEEVLRVARHERDLMTDFAAGLRARGTPAPTVSIGSTPTITSVDHLRGIDEVRPGNYIFFDAFQAAIGSCRLEDCALTVLAAVVHRDRSRRKVVIDAGAIALSKDRGAVETDAGCGYGHVLDLEGNSLGLRVGGLSQEHGEISVPDESLLDRLKVGTRVRVLANHSCLTAAQHAHYQVLEGARVVDRWEIHRGW